MPTLGKTKRRLLEDLKDVESRQIFHAEHIASAIPIQIRELRKKRKLTQKRLAELSETDQSNISNWENPNYEYTPQIGTLERLANAFDVPLIVRFGSWEEIWDWDNNVTSEKLAPAEFKDALPALEALVTKAEAESTPTRPRTPLRLIYGGDEPKPDRKLLEGHQSAGRRSAEPEETEPKSEATGLWSAVAGGKR